MAPRPILNSAAQLAWGQLLASIEGQDINAGIGTVTLSAGQYLPFYIESGTIASGATAGGVVLSGDIQSMDNVDIAPVFANSDNTTGTSSTPLEVTGTVTTAGTLTLDLVNRTDDDIIVGNGTTAVYNSLFSGVLIVP